jgi:hypothetical protein
LILLDERHEAKSADTLLPAGGGQGRFFCLARNLADPGIAVLNKPGEACGGFRMGDLSQRKGGRGPHLGILIFSKNK